MSHTPAPCPSFNHFTSYPYTEPLGDICDIGHIENLRAMGEGEGP